MDTLLINEILWTHFPTKRAYIGTLPCNKLPKTIQKVPLATVVNTDEDMKPGTHWIAMYLPAKGQPIEYFDSYGGEPKNPYIIKFLESKDSFKYNSRRVQHLFSTTCGQHCIYFLTKRASGTSYNDIMNTYSHTNYGQNDSMVKLFCERKFGFRLHKDKAQKFLNSQIFRQLIHNLNDITFVI